MSPLRDAVGLVDCDERGRKATELFEQPRRLEPLGRDVHQPVLPCRHRPLATPQFLRIERGRQVSGFDAALSEGTHLVLHQRDQRRDDDRRSLEDRGGKLIAEGLSAPGRRDDQDALSAPEKLVNGLSLPRPKLGQSEPLAQRHVDVGHGRQAPYCGRRTHAIVIALFHRQLRGFTAVRRRKRPATRSRRLAP